MEPWSNRSKFYSSRNADSTKVRPLFRTSTKLFPRVENFKNLSDSLSAYNFLCSLLAFSLKVFNENDSTNKLANIIVLIDATRVPVKALRLILKACQNALAYKIKQAIIIELDRFFNQQRISLDILLESYDFKVKKC
jgi:hypothetical protein